MDYSLILPTSSGDTSKPLLMRDPLQIGANNDGIRCIFDAGFEYSYPGGPLIGRPTASAPVHGATVVDVSGHADGRIVIPSGETMAFSGKGFDFTPTTKRNTYLEIPAAVASDLWTAFGGNSQLYLICAYLKFPTPLLWSDITDVNAYLPLIGWAGPPAGADGSGYATTPEIATLGIRNTGSTIATFQKTQSTSDTAGLNQSFVAKHYGQVLTQVAMWRTSTAIGMRLKSAAGQDQSVAAQSTANTVNFSAQTGKIGMTSAAQWPATGLTFSTDWRVYRTFVENLARSGRDPITVLDADYARTVARGVFS